MSPGITGDTLINRASIHINMLSTDDWSMTPSQNGLNFYIRKKNTDVVLTYTQDGNVIEDDIKKNGPFTENDIRQLWGKEDTNLEGFFILRSSDSLKVLTAIDSKNLEIKGTLL